MTGTLTPRVPLRRRTRRSRPRARTIATKKLTRAILALGAAEVEGVEVVSRPKTRAECPTGPCPWVACKHHLYLDVNPETGSIKINFPDLEPWELKHSCALDVAERGGRTLEWVGEAMNLTRERIRQVELRGLIQVKRAAREFGHEPDVGPERVFYDEAGHEILSDARRQSIHAAKQRYRDRRRRAAEGESR